MPSKITSTKRVRQTQSSIDVSPSRKPARLVYIDTLRSLSIVLMILTHVTAIFFDFKNDSLLQAVSLAGGTICFTVFLFLFGVSNALSFSDIQDSTILKQKRQRLLLRAFQILLIYYISAFVVTFVSQNGFYGLNTNQVVYELLRIIYLQQIPLYTEFLLAFPAYVVILVILRGPITYITKNFLRTITAGLILYLTGYVLYYLPVTDVRIQVWKSLIVGQSDLHTFPIFQYAFVLLIGLYIGFFIYESKTFSKTLTRLILITITQFITYITCAIAIVLIGSSSLINTHIFNARFPPSIAFLAFGLGIALLLLTFLYTQEHVLPRISKRIRPISFLISSSALSVFLFHIIFMFIFKYVWELSNDRTLNLSSSSDILFLVAGILVMSVLAAKASHLLYVTTIGVMTGRSKFRLVMVMIICLSIGATLWIFYRNRTFIYSSQLAVSSSPERILGMQAAQGWWNDEYVGRYVIDTSERVINADRTVYVQIDHTDLLERKLSFFEDARDIVVVRHGATNEEINVSITGASSTSTNIYFRLPENTADEYSIYFGNKSASKRESSETNISEFATNLKKGNEVLRSVQIEMSKQWYLKGYKIESDRQLGLEISSELPIDNIQLFLENGTEEVAKFNYKLENGKATVSIPIVDLPVGEYTIKARGISITDSIQELESKLYRFYITYPIFVNWSIDWEGFAVNQIDLDDIAAISQAYNIPITHYFNPRIYVQDQFDNFPMSPELAAYYTSWVINRKNINGDEIGLHIHMFPDLLKELEIEVIAGAEVIGIGRNETRLNAYSLEDLTKLFKWSIEKFQERGLGTPESFRAGAWMMNETVFAALEELGFQYDSSGRSGGLLNPAVGSSNTIPWNLAATTKPYRPSRSNMNLQSPPQFSLWEFPNNGADSYWFSAEELINRFKVNYQKIMTAPQVVTYLSHPHSFKVYDSDKIRTLLNYTSNFSYELDSGPVVHTTLEHIYDNFDLSNF